MTRDEAISKIYIDDIGCPEQAGMMPAYDVEKLINQIFDEMGKCKDCDYGVLEDGPNDLDIVLCEPHAQPNYREQDQYSKLFRRRNKD
jgi:hypothetical protein